MSSICRLCLSTSSKYYEDLKLIDQQQIQLVLSEIDLDIVRSPLICSNCLELLKTTYIFKVNCLETEQLIESYIRRYNQQDVDLNNVLRGQLVYKDNTDKNIVDKSLLNIKNELKFDADDENNDYISDDFMVTDSQSSEKEKDDNQVKLFTCGICAEMYEAKQQLLDHISVHFRRPKCNVCKETLLNLIELKEHSVSVHGIPLSSVSENFDGVEFELDQVNMNKAMKKHLEVYTVEQKNNTDDSNTETDDEFHYEKKTGNILGNNCYRCEVCDKIFAEKHYLSSHMKRHFHLLRCSTCNKLFSTIQSFRKHILAVHKTIFKQKLQDLEDILKIEYNKENQNISNNCPICYKTTTSCTCSDDISCNSCHKTISKDVYFKHKIAHLIRNNNFDCEYCQKTFTRKSGLTRHIEEVHLGIRKQYTPRSIYTCDICGLTTHRKSRLTQHMRTHTGVYTVEQKYNTDDSINIETDDDFHYEKKTGNILGNNCYRCEVCDKIFAEKNYLSSHMKRHFHRLRCSTCNKLFSTIQSFRKHILALHKTIFKQKLQDLEDILKIEYNKENQNFSNNCPICYKSTTFCTCSDDISCNSCNKTISKDVYFKHKIAHLIRNNNFDCEYCQKTFTRKSGLTRHIEEVHLGIRKQYTPRSIYTCDICGLTTHRKSRLTQHMRTHTSEKPYKCDECGKAFAQSSQLGVHKRTKHSTYSRFTCEYCSKPLKSKFSLNMHILIMHKYEELERKFACHVCEKKFRFPGELTNHLTWHSEDRRYSCEVCRKRFVTQPLVKKHMVIHSGEKKHKCEICGKGFHHKSYKGSYESA